jgi:hypothetical protein
MQPKVLKYILDIQSVMTEIESVKIKSGNNFQNFES